MVLAATELKAKVVNEKERSSAEVPIINWFTPMGYFSVNPEA